MRPSGFQKATSSKPKKSNLELFMENFILTQTRQNDEFRNQNLITNETIMKLNTKVDNIVIHTNILETQIS